MELVIQDAALVRVTSTRPFAMQALVVTAVIIAAVIGSAFVWTDPSVNPTEQAGTYPLDPALVQFRERERESGAVEIRAGTLGLDSALILLRKGEHARLSRGTSDPVGCSTSRRSRSAGPMKPAADRTPCLGGWARWQPSPTLSR